MDISELPAFVVEHVQTDGEEPCLRGRFTHLRGVRIGRSWLYAGYDSLIGDLELDRGTSRGVFIAPFWSLKSPIQVGSVAPWIDSRWQAYHVAMIFDSTTTWRKEPFVASDAQHFRKGDIHGWTKAGSKLAEDAVPTTLELGGWDHEHCELCEGHIGRGGAPIGYVNDSDRWLCPSCYERYAKLRSVAVVFDLAT